ncbi:MAG: hypothetical protein Q7U30_09480, partial [Methylicorpusculum sp.]|nr:hypothetical protein [Methylicorpusculum sp.]
MPPINIIRYRLIFLLLAGLKVAPVTAQTQATPQISSIVQLQIQDAIGPATSDYIERSMDKAVESGAKAV